MKTSELETIATELLEVGQRINRLNRQNVVYSETQTSNQEDINSEIKELVERYNELATNVTENTEFDIKPYVIMEQINSNGQTILRTTNN